MASRAAARRTAAAHGGRGDSAGPLVSCIMPTHDRRRFVPQAIRQFQRQTYVSRELIILDDGADAIADLVPDDDPRIRYERLPGRLTLGAKRNAACELARGDVIMHWDDDDWMADHRIALQLDALLGGQAELCGTDRLLFLDPSARRAWRYVYQGARRPWLAGGTLCYTRDLWRRQPFAHLDIGEDSRFVWRNATGNVVVLEDAGFYVAMIHAGNTSPKRTRGSCWEPLPLDAVRGLMAEGDWAFYTSPRPRVGMAAGARHEPSMSRTAHAAPASGGPRVSLVLPVHTAAAPLLERALLALSAQTCDADDFEVIIAADGGDPTGQLAAAARRAEQSFSCRLVESPRPRGEEPHRNHARNAGCRAAVAPLLWVLDADFVLPPHAIEHVLATSATPRARAAVLSPCLAGIATTPAEWLRLTQPAVDARDAGALVELALAQRTVPDQYSGFADRHRAGPPLSESWPRLREGFPLLPRRVWEALDGFDERYVGWGGNKEEFVRRLLALARAGLVEVRLLRSVLALHQPHAPDPQKHAANGRRRQNQQRFHTLLRELVQDAPWWRAQRARARAVLQTGDPQPRAAAGATNAHRAGAANGRAGGAGLTGDRPVHRSRRVRDVPDGRRALRVGILTVNDPRKGLWRDAETLHWALTQPPVRPRGTGTIDVSLFPASSLQPGIERDPVRAAADAVRDHASPAAAAAVRPGTRFDSWMRSLDVLIASEVWLPRAFARVRQAGVRLVFIPNLDWAHIGGDTAAWVRAVAGGGAEVWAKTRCAADVLQRHGIAARAVPWSIPDPVRRERAIADDRPLHLFLGAGMGGWHNRRGVDIALAAFALARAREPGLLLTLHSIRPVADYVPDAPAQVPGLTVREGFLPREELATLYDDADVVLYPTRFDGFGISLLESLHTGLPVLCMAGEPMRELVEHEHNGLLVPAAAAGTVRLAPRWECTPAALADAIVRIAREPALRRRLTCPEPGALVARQHAFVMRVRELVCRESTPRVVVLHDDRPGHGARRSELFWADALRAHGYTVDCCGFGEDAARRRGLLASEPDLVLVGKASERLIASVRSETRAPLVMWHHDLSDATPERARWFREAAPQCDLVAVPHDVDPADVRGVPIVHLYPGARVAGDRGPGRRPRTVRTEEATSHIAFLGRALPDRVALLRTLAAECEVRVYGEVAAWRGSGLTCAGPRFDGDADDAIARAAVVVSMSLRHDLHYTSNRLFHAAAAGGCVLVRSFPGLDALYPADAVARWTQPSEATRQARALLADPERRRRLRLRAEEHTFRHHTWVDRVTTLLEHVRQLPAAARTTPARTVSRQSRQTRTVQGTGSHGTPERPVRQRATALPASAPPAPGYVPPRFWQARTERLGERSAGHHRWSDDEFRRQTERCWAAVDCVLAAHRTAADRTILDYGCGAARFSVRLAGAGFQVTGADITPAMLELARRRRADAPFDLVRIAAGGAIPFGDGSFDAIWTSLALQHVPDDDFARTAAELRRVARAGALVVLFENTLDHGARTSGCGHTVFRTAAEYAGAFPGVRVAGQIDIEGEPHSILVGRLRA